MLCASYRHFAGFALVLLGVFFSANASADKAPEKTSAAKIKSEIKAGEFAVSGYLPLGFGGGAGWRGGRVHIGRGARVSFGAGLRGELGLHKYFSVGVGVEWLSWDDHPDEYNRSHFLTFAVNPKGRFPIKLKDKMTIVPYLTVPFGPTFLFANSDRANGSFRTGAHAGYGLAILPGVAVMFGTAFAIFLELGYRRNHVWDAGHGHDLVLQQFASNAGVSLIF